MSAYMQMVFQMSRGNDEDFQSVLHVLEEIGGKTIEDLKHYDLHINNMGFRIENGFPNIWGKDFLETDPVPFIRFAKAAPKAEWTASSLRHYDVDGTESEDKASYAHGTLNYESMDFFKCVMDYEELCEYVEDYLGEKFDGKLNNEILEQCFDEINSEVSQMFDGQESLEKAKKAVFHLECDGSLLCLHKPDSFGKDEYLFSEYYLCGKEPESFEGKTFVIGGKLSLISTYGLENYIKKHGGFVGSSVSQKTDFFISNNADISTSKVKKAIEFGVPMITEIEFISRFGYERLL